ncbi:Flagellar hook-basal body complex protein FliE [Buchnera aphidicola (Thelaxes suberi)]|uniref:flagellar hook-basal body complex protein FliE n=1 Tax=Buchnera aphidicola TaxID=9 RepID=UPI003463CD0B
MIQKFSNNHIYNHSNNTINIKNNLNKFTQNSKKKIHEYSNNFIDFQKKLDFIKKESLDQQNIKKINNKVNNKKTINKIKKLEKKNTAILQHELYLSHLFIELEKTSLSLSIINTIKQKVLDAYQEIFRTSV